MSNPQPPPAPAPRHAQQRRPDPIDTEPAAAADESEFSRFALVVALSIAVVSVLGALVGWRAELHAATASRYEQDAVAASITAAQLSSEAETAAAKAYSQYSHYVQLGHLANELQPGACDSTQRNTIVQLDAGTVCSTQIQFSGYANTGYLDKSGHFDVQKYAKDVEAGDATRNDTEPATYQEQAEQQRHREDQLLYLSLFLVLALALLTLARLGRSTAARLVLAIPGWACLIGGAIYLAAAEL